MDTPPAVGTGKGLFDIFVPGVFLLLNLGGALFILPLAHGLLVWQPTGWAGSAVIGTTLGISFGYLLGVILRVLRVNAADRLSALFLQYYSWRPWRRSVHSPAYLTDRFPFIDSLRIRCHRDYPQSAAAFFDEVWAKANDGGGGQAFFNLCKLMVISEDERMAAEINAAEALTRYMASICYALAMSWIAWSGAALWLALTVHAVPMPVFFLLVTYVLAIAVIMRNLRLVRLKEVETVFGAAFKCRGVLFGSRER
jgi:hypothetical protein